jgi:hypothetical protein
MVEKEMSYNSSYDVIEHWHGFNPFCKVIDDHNNVFMNIDKRRVTIHEINGPFAKRAYEDDRVQ